MDEMQKVKTKKLVQKISLLILVDGRDYCYGAGRVTLGSWPFNMDYKVYAKLCGEGLVDASAKESRLIQRLPEGSSFESHKWGQYAQS